MTFGGGSRRNPAVASDGVPVWQPSSGNHKQAGSNLPRMRSHCPVPPASAHGDAGRWPQTRVCRNGECRTLFFLCRSCDRGQHYCSLACRRHARLRQRRGANCRHQQSIEGRLDHRDRQRRYRYRRIQARVTDQGSFSVPYPPLCRSERLEPEIPEQTAAALLPRWPPRHAGVRICCCVCGRPGRWFEPFPPTP